MSVLLKAALLVAALAVTTVSGAITLEATCNNGYVRVYHIAGVTERTVFDMVWYSGGPDTEIISDFIVEPPNTDGHIALPLAKGTEADQSLRLRYEGGEDLYVEQPANPVLNTNCAIEPCERGLGFCDGRGSCNSVNFDNPTCICDAGFKGDHCDLIDTSTNPQNGGFGFGDDLFPLITGFVIMAGVCGTLAYRQYTANGAEQRKLDMARMNTLSTLSEAGLAGWRATGAEQEPQPAAAAAPSEGRQSAGGSRRSGGSRASGGSRRSSGGGGGGGSARKPKRVASIATTSAGVDSVGAPLTGTSGVLGRETRAPSKKSKKRKGSKNSRGGRRTGSQASQASQA